MFGLMKSLGELASNVANVALAPLQIAADLATAATQPLADAAQDLVKDAKNANK